MIAFWREEAISSCGFPKPTQEVIASGRGGAIAWGKEYALPVEEVNHLRPDAKISQKNKVFERQSLTNTIGREAIA